MTDEAPQKVDYAAEREALRAEYVDLSLWWTGATDEAMLNAAQDFASSAKAHAYARQAAMASDPDKYRRLVELDTKLGRWFV